MDFRHRLREIDSDVEQLRAAVAALQRQVAADQARRTAPSTRGRGDRDDFLRSYA